MVSDTCDLNHTGSVVCMLVFFSSLKLAIILFMKADFFCISAEWKTVCRLTIFSFSFFLFFFF